jgi:hypothetical protein
MPRKRREKPKEANPRSRVIEQNKVERGSKIKSRIVDIQVKIDE